MKKILTLLLIVFAFKTGWAQEENELKNFRFGLKAIPSINWYQPDDKKKFEGAGARAKFGYGLITEFRLNKVVSFGTGLQFDYGGGALTFKDTAVYFVKNDELQEIKDVSSTMADSTAGSFILNTRRYNANYITIPITLKMKTKEIGMLTYYGMFGINASARTKARANDEFTALSVPKGSTYDGSEIDITDDMNLFKFAVNIGGGAEYNLSGTTSAVFGLNFYKGFSNVLRNESKYLQQSTTVNVPVKQKAYENAIALTVGILF